MSTLVCNAKIVGTVSYVNSSSRRVAIPHGPCRVDEQGGNVLIQWVDGVLKSTTIPLPEYIAYTNNKDIKLVVDQN